MIINDDIESKVIIQFENESMDPSIAKKSMDVEIVELKTPQSTNETDNVSVEKTIIDWEVLCSQSLDVLGYPNSVNAAGLKVLPYDIYRQTYNALDTLKSTAESTTEKLIQQENEFKNLFDSAKTRYAIIYQSQTGQIYIDEYAVFESMLVKLNDIFLTLDELKSTINASTNIIKID
jgi:hypothetical protein